MSLTVVGGGWLRDTGGRSGRRSNGGRQESHRDANRFRSAVGFFDVAERFSSVVRASGVLRVSPFSIRSSNLAKPARWVAGTEPETFSSMNRRGSMRYPAAAICSRWFSVSCSTVDTRAYANTRDLRIRNSLDYASWKDRKLLAAAIRSIYTAPQRGGGAGRA